MKILVSVLGDCIHRKPWHDRGGHVRPKMVETGLDLMKPAKNGGKKLYAIASRKTTEILKKYQMAVDIWAKKTNTRVCFCNCQAE